MNTPRTAITTRWASAGVIAGLVVGAALSVAAPAEAKPAVPYVDPAVHGYLGLCDRNGHQVTSGNLATRPFAWRAVSSVAAPAPYNTAGRTATLLAFQPREAVPAGEWSGNAITASSRYSNPAHPMTAATVGDDSLADFVAAFHPQWDGFLQVRMYLGAPNQPTYAVSYPALDIQVTGTTWHAVGGGRVDCANGRSVSLETIVLTRHEIAARVGKEPQSTVAASRSHATNASTAGSDLRGAEPVALRTASASQPVTSVLTGAALAALTIIAGAVFALRRRRTAPAVLPARHQPTKGR